MKALEILAVGGIALIGGIFIGRVFQRKMDQLVIIELVEQDGETSLGYLKFEGANIDLVADIGEATPTSLEDALRIRRSLPIAAGQKLYFMSIEDAALIMAVQTA